MKTPFPTQTDVTESEGESGAEGGGEGEEDLGEGEGGEGEGEAVVVKAPTTTEAPTTTATAPTHTCKSADYFSAAQVGFITGHAIGQFKGASLEECQMKCVENDACKSMHYSAATQTCGLKSTATPAGSAKTAHAWQQAYSFSAKLEGGCKETTIPATTTTATAAKKNERCTFEPGLPGFIKSNFLVGTKDGTLEDCRSLCGTNPKCLAFTFEPNGGDCRLKSSDTVVSTAAWQKQHTAYIKVCSPK